MYWSSNLNQIKIHFYFFILHWFSFSIPTLSSEFGMYRLNGGLVSAVAGKNYVLIASDTRLTDGGYNIWSRNHLDSRLWFTSSYDLECNDLVSYSGSILFVSDDYNREWKSINISSPTIVGSAGCSADCEAIKRIINSQITSQLGWLHGSSTPSTSTIVTILSRTLYSRRYFPFYTFCVLASLDHGEGKVYSYDSLGSYERVATASAGQGNEMLQPILDRLFITRMNDNTTVSTPGKDVAHINANKQRIGLALYPPVKTFVDCDVDRCVEFVWYAYQGVAERDVNIGDNVVMCILRENNEKVVQLKVLSRKLKKH